MVALLPRVILLLLWIIAVVMSRYGTTSFRSLVVGTHTREMYIEYSSYICTYFCINFFFIFLNYSNTPQNITNSSLMGTIFPYLSWNMYPLFKPFFTRDTINNNTHFLTYTPESVVDTTGVRWYLSPVSPFNLPRNEIIMYNTTSPY